MTTSSELKQRIHRNGSERALITICLSEPKQIIECATQGLTPDMFAVDGHRFIYMAINYLVTKDKNPDPVSILNVYNSEEATKAIEELGGIDYMEAMLKTKVTPNVELYIGHIKQASARREVYLKSEQLQKDALRDETTGVNEYLGLAENAFRELGLKFTSDNEVYRMGADINERLKERIKNPNPVPGLKIGWDTFDRVTGGLKDGELTIIGARSKVGKSVALANWARKVAVEDNIPVLYIDTEMSNVEQEDRLVAMISGVPEDEIKNGMFVKDTYNGKAKSKIKKVQEATKAINESNFFHVYLPYFTAESVSALVKKYQVKEGIRMVIFDYIKMPSSDSKNVQQEYQMLGFFTSALKDLAGSLQITVVSAVQLNRQAVGAEEINESMVAGSDRILQLANRLCFLRNKTEEEYAMEGGAVGGNQKFKIAFQRGGQSDVPDIMLNFNRPIIRMDEVG